MTTRSRINGLLSGLEQGMGVRTGFERKLHYPAVINDAKLAEKVAALVGDAAVTPEPMMVSEDFAFYQHEVPGLFLFLGCGNAGKGFVSPLHTPRFDFDEAALLPGLETFWRIALCGGMV
jgi:hippurate hydrolase